MTVEPKWERVQSDNDRGTKRLAVPGGWLYLVTETDIYGGIVNQMTVFVPKPAPRAKEPKA